MLRITMIDLTLYPIALLAILVIVQICKGYIKPKFGNIGVQLFIALLSFLAAGLWIAKEWFTPETISVLVGIWVSANGIYQIIGKYVFEALGDLVSKK